MTGKDRIQADVLREIERNNFNGCIILPTGSGKARIMVECIKRYNPKSVLYLCDNQDLRDTTFAKEVELWGGSSYSPVIDMQCYQTAYKWEGKEYDMILCDEADFAITPKYSLVFKNIKANKRLLFTGTMTPDKKSFVKTITPIIYEADIKEVEKHKVVNKARVTLVKFEMTAMESDKYRGYNKAFATLLGNSTNLTKAEKWRLKSLQLGRKLLLQSLKSSAVATRELMKILHATPTNKVLIFCGQTEQADRICKWSYHGKNEGENNLERFNNGDVRFLSVVSKIDRGINLNGVNCVIFESPTRSKTKTMQRSGRARRLAVDEVTDLYFMIPYYRTFSNDLKPSVVLDYVMESGEELDLDNAKHLHIQI